MHGRRRLPTMAPSTSQITVPTSSRNKGNVPSFLHFEACVLNLTRLVAVSRPYRCRISLCRALKIAIEIAGTGVTTTAIGKEHELL
jgi:hypothetical protein